MPLVKLLSSAQLTPQWSDVTKGAEGGGGVYTTVLAEGPAAVWEEPVGPVVQPWALPPALPPHRAGCVPSLGLELYCLHLNTHSVWMQREQDPSTPTQDGKTDKIDKIER